MGSKVYGYCRVSTMKQSIERQIRNVKAVYPDAVIVVDEYTGTRLDRPGWMKLYRQLQPGDTIVFDQVSRMSRDADEGFQVYEELFRRGVNLIFLKEPHINTETYKKALENGVPMTGTNVDFILEGVNKYLLSLAKEQIRLAFDQAEKEVEDLHQRTREGIETARLNGKQIGQPKGAKEAVEGFQRGSVGSGSHEVDGNRKGDILQVQERIEREGLNHGCFWNAEHRRSREYSFYWRSGSMSGICREAESL